jgi:hypothetical protein
MVTATRGSPKGKVHDTPLSSAASLRRRRTKGGAHASRTFPPAASPHDRVWRRSARRARRTRRGCADGADVAGESPADFGHRSRADAADMGGASPDPHAAASDQRLVILGLRLGLGRHRRRLRRRTCRPDAGRGRGGRSPPQKAALALARSVRAGASPNCNAHRPHRSTLRCYGRRSPTTTRVPPAHGGRRRPRRHARDGAPGQHGRGRGRPHPAPRAPALAARTCPRRATCRSTRSSC